MRNRCSYVFVVVLVQNYTSGILDATVASFGVTRNIRTRVHENTVYQVHLKIGRDCLEFVRLGFQIEYLISEITM